MSSSKERFSRLSPITGPSSEFEETIPTFISGPSMDFSSVRPAPLISEPSRKFDASEKTTTAIRRPSRSINLETTTTRPTLLISEPSQKFSTLGEEEEELNTTTPAIRRPSRSIKSASTRPALLIKGPSQKFSTLGEEEEELNTTSAIRRPSRSIKSAMKTARPATLISAPSQKFSTLGEEEEEEVLNTTSAIRRPSRSIKSAMKTARPAPLISEPSQKFSTLGEEEEELDRAFVIFSGAQPTGTAIRRPSRSIGASSAAARPTSLISGPSQAAARPTSLISEPSQKISSKRNSVASSAAARPTSLISGPSQQIFPKRNSIDNNSTNSNNNEIMMAGLAPTKLIPGPSLAGNQLANGGVMRPSPHRAAPRKETSIPWHALSRQQSSDRVIIIDSSIPTSIDIHTPTVPTNQLMCNETVAVFNANTTDGSRIVRALSKSGANVVAIVRVFTSKNTESLLQMPNVKIHVGGQLDEQAAVKALTHGVDRVFLCLKYWERFTSDIERQQAEYIVKACVAGNVPYLVFSTFEDTKLLRASGYKSQIVPDVKGHLEPPQFENMQTVKKMAKSSNIKLTHMITSYLDEEKSKKSLCLIVGENGKLIVQPHLMEE